MRVIGNAFEYLVCQVLLNHRFVPSNCATQRKLYSLRRDFLSQRARFECAAKQPHLVTALRELGVLGSSAVRTGGAAGGRAFTLTCDAHGKAGDAADVVVQLGTGAVYRLSLKHNNQSIKHQRPHMLWKHLGLLDPDKEAFQTAFRSINNKWMRSFKPYAQYCDVPTGLKKAMYADVLRLCRDYIMGAPRECHANLLRFLEGAADTHVLVWSRATGTVSVWNTSDKSTRTRPRVHSIQQANGTTLILRCNCQKVIKMRLHTASKGIKGNSLSLKFDTTYGTDN